ncbi:MAG: hypothetical protein UZ22_OP11002000800, partial [Microgenomates bacterium OLB23]
QIGEAELAKLPELEAWAKDTAEELNAILEEHGFSIRLTAWQKAPGKFGVVALYDITLKWLVEGETESEWGMPYEHDGKPFFRLPLYEAELGFYETTDAVVGMIPAKNGDVMCFTRAPKPLEQFELLAEAERWHTMLMNHSLLIVGKYNGLRFPNILYNSEKDGPIDISWLCGLHTTDATDQGWRVAEALMQAMFAVGPKGARAKVAVAVAMESFSIGGPTDYVADHDLLIWLKRPNLDLPYFVAYVPKEAFADHTVGLEEIDG